MQPQAVMFDLDGTLADTLTDLTEAANGVRADFHMDPLPPARYRYLVGQGAPWLMQHTLELADDDPRIEGAVQRFKENLAAQAHANSAPYPGIPQLLDALVQRDLPLAVLSNKPDAATVELVEWMFDRWPFAEVRGHRDGTSPKPDPAGALAMAESVRVPAKRWLYVGDSRVDMLTANNAGMCAVGVTWGFREEKELRESGAHHIIHTPGELLALCDGGEK